MLQLSSNCLLCENILIEFRSLFNRLSNNGAPAVTCRATITYVLHFHFLLALLFAFANYFPEQRSLILDFIRTLPCCFWDCTGTFAPEDLASQREVEIVPLLPQLLEWKPWPIDPSSISRDLSPFPRCWVDFQVIHLTDLSGRLRISSSFCPDVGPDFSPPEISPYFPQRNNVTNFYTMAKLSESRRSTS